MDALCTAPAGTGGGMVWTPVSTPTSTYAVALGVPGWTEAAPSRAVRHARTGDHHVLEINAQIDH